jgi:transposase
MTNLSLDLRRRIVEAYRSKKSGTYKRTASLFGISAATLGRLLLRYRETGDVFCKPKGGNNPRRVDLDWLREHLRAHADARLVDRVDAWERHVGKRVSLTAMSDAVRACGWTYKKNRWLPVSRTAQS